MKPDAPIHSDAPRGRLRPLPPVFPFAWAVAHGEDRCGLWQAFEVAGVRQVLRWIPPGRFLMGSTESEPGRSDGELQHWVVLTRGFWLADTACTQALWQAVTGNNPGRFEGGDEAPVERVSWDDVMRRFLPALNERVKGLEAMLPSEAQWEYACRAGSAGPFWFGEQIDSKQVNFDGNHPMPSGRKGEYRERTVGVKVLPANGWGLYQMHGNVLEWCADGFRPYVVGEAVDPVHHADESSAVGPDRRMLRGGSWVNVAHHCRSASREALVPLARLVNIGFRLARGAC